MQNSNDVLKDGQMRAAISGAKMFPCDRKKKYHLNRAWNEIIAEYNQEEKEYLTLQHPVLPPDSLE
eukprot:1165301-Ditylum_brightwellii.AAC.1